MPDLTLEGGVNMYLNQVILTPISSVVAGAAGQPSDAPHGWHREVLVDTKTRTIKYWPKTEEDSVNQ